MSIRRARLPFEGQYVQIPNAWMRDQRLTHRARGLLAEIMTHHEDWTISQSSLWRNAPEGREAIRKAVLELVAAGYLRLDQDRAERGRFGEANYVLTPPNLADVTATQKLGRGRETGVRSTAPQESTPKEDHKEEDHPEGGRAAAAPPVMSPTCTRHPDGTDRPCAACKRQRLIWEQNLAAASAPVVTPRNDPWVEGLCRAHLQRADTCDACAADRAHGYIA